MQRRRFLTNSLAAASALALPQVSSAMQAGSSAANGATPLTGASASTAGRQFYALRKYNLVSGPDVKVTDTFAAEALIPALNRLGIKDVGAFKLTVGPETPTLYLLLPATNLETLVTADLHLAQDSAFMSAAAPFWSASLTGQPPFSRCDSHLLLAFEGFPTLAVPEKGKRIFHLRTYYSPTHAGHARKVEMFHNGEFAIFKKSGCQSVFYGSNLVGSELPSLTYMLTFPDQAALDAGWARFFADPDWKKLAADPRFTDPIVSRIDNLILTPTPYSQI